MGKPKAERAGANESTYFEMGLACSRILSELASSIGSMTWRRCHQRPTTSATRTVGAATSATNGPTRYAELVIGYCHDHSSGLPNVHSSTAKKNKLTSR